VFRLFSPARQHEFSKDIPMLSVLLLFFSLRSRRCLCGNLKETFEGAAFSFFFFGDFHSVHLPLVLLLRDPVNHARLEGCSPPTPFAVNFRPFCSSSRRRQTNYARILCSLSPVSPFPPPDPFFPLQASFSLPRTCAFLYLFSTSVLLK